MNSVYHTTRLDFGMLFLIVAASILLLAIFGGKGVRRALGFVFATGALLMLVMVPLMFVGFRSTEMINGKLSGPVVHVENRTSSGSSEDSGRRKQQEIKKVRRALQKQAKELEKIGEELDDEIVSKVQLGVEALIAKLHETEDLEYHDPEVEIQLDDIDDHINAAKKIVKRLEDEGLNGDDVMTFLSGVFSDHITRKDDGGYEISLNFGDDESDCDACQDSQNDLPSWVNVYIEEDLHEPKWDKSEKVYRQIVEVGPYSTEEELNANRRTELSKAFRDFASWRRDELARTDASFESPRLDRYWPTEAGRDIERRYVSRRHVSDTYSEALELAGSDGNGKLEYIELEFDSKLQRRVDGHWRDVKSSMRAAQAGSGALGIMGLVGILFGYLRFTKPKS
ncbi:MAG: hypothetical protein AAF497_06405, partial [Planctomycetota bacterium]